MYQDILFFIKDMQPLHFVSFGIAFFSLHLMFPNRLFRNGSIVFSIAALIFYTLKFVKIISISSLTLFIVCSVISAISVFAKCCKSKHESN